MSTTITVHLDTAELMRRTTRVEHMPTKRHGSRAKETRYQRRRSRAELRATLRAGGEE